MSLKKLWIASLGILVACSNPANQSATTTIASSNIASSNIASTTGAPTTTAAPTTAAPTTAPPTTAPTTTQPLVPTDKPETAQEMAAALTDAEAAIRGRITEEAKVEWGKRQQKLYFWMDADEALAAAAIQEVDGAAHPEIALNYEARKALTRLVENYTIADTLPAWSIEEPLPASELLPLYKAAEAETGIDWEYLAAINLVETRMGRINGVSTAGAVGPMQFLPTTWAECCVGDPTVPADAIMGAGQYLVDRGGPDNMDKAILGYNNSKNYVAAVKLYAEVLRQNETAYSGYHAWQVYFRSTEGTAVLPVGYYQETSVDAATWLAENPDNLLD